MDGAISVRAGQTFMTPSFLLLRLLLLLSKSNSRSDMERNSLVEKEFWEAVDHGDGSGVKEILRKNPSIGVNWKNPKEVNRAALHRACVKGHDSIVFILLIHPDIDVNLTDKDGETPFMRACREGKTLCVRLLLQDRRVKVNEPKFGGDIPLRQAAGNGKTEVVTLLERFKSDGSKTRSEVRGELGISGQCSIFSPFNFSFY